MNMSEETRPQNDSYIRVCPYLKLVCDDSIKFGYPDEANYCYRPQKPQAVALSYQEQVCVHGPYRECPVHAPEWEGVLPEDISRAEVEIRGKFNFGFVGSIALFLVFFIVGAFRTPVVQSALWTHTPTLVVSAMPVAILASPTAMFTPTSTAVPALATPAPALMETIAPATLTGSDPWSPHPSNTPAPPEG